VRLGRMERPAVLGQPLFPHRADPLGVFAVLQPTDPLVGKAYPAAAAPQTRDRLTLEPGVQDLGQKDLRPQRGQHPALGRSFGRNSPDSFFPHAGLKPLVDPSSDEAVLDPPVQRRPPLRRIDGPEVVRDIQIQDPSAVPFPEGVPQGFQGLVGRTAGTEPLRAVPKVLFVERFQEHHDRPWGDRVLLRRNPQRSERALVFLDLPASDRRGLAAARFQPLQQPLQVLPKRVLLGLRRHPVEAGGPVFPGPSIRLVPPVVIQVVVPREEDALRRLPGPFCSPSLFRGPGIRLPSPWRVSL